MDLSRKIGLYLIILWSLADIWKASSRYGGNRTQLISKFMNMTKYELQDIFDQRTKLHIYRHGKNCTRRSRKHRLSFRKLAEVFQRRPRRTVVSYLDEMTIGQMHNVAKTSCPCGAKPMIDIILQVRKKTVIVFSNQLT